MGAADTAQLNARLSSDLKERGDAVLASFGRSATDAIRSLWAYMAATRSLPSFMEPDTVANSQEHARELAASGMGMALTLAREAGVGTSAVAGLRDMSFGQLRETAFEESLAEGRFDYA